MPEPEKYISPAAPDAPDENVAKAPIPEIRGILSFPIILGELTMASPETQTTVGSAGTASALPANPSGYLRLMLGDTEFVIPYYAQS